LDTKDYIYHGNFVSDNNFKLDIKDSQMIFDGNIYNAKGIINISNSKVNFQGHPIIHAYIDKQSLTNLKKFGQDAFVKGEHIDQNNWENRIFSLKELNLNNTFFNLSSYAALEVQNLNAKNSNIVLGSNEINIDEKDTENIFHQNIGDSYGYDVLTGIGKEMFYEQNLKSIDKSHVKEVYFKGNLNLDNSDAFVYKTNFEGKINAFNNNKMVSLLHSKFKGKVSAKNLDLNENMIFGSIKALNLNALNNTFILDLDNRDRIISMESSDGGGNTILFDKIKNSDKNILLASLIDNKKKLNKQYFSFPSIQKGFSNYTPNIEFSRNGKELKWILTKVESENKPNLENSFFHTSDNKQALSTANSLVDHFILNYIAEWNNMQKRLGELRDNPYDYGVWLRNFGGKLSDKNSDGNYFEFQVGLDKQSEFSNSNFYSGFMLNFTQNKLNSNSLDVKSKGYGIGSYFSFLFDNNFYLDFVLRYVRYENDMSANFLPNVNSFLQSNASNNIITSLELGYRKYFNNFYFEPQIEFISGYVDNVHLFNDNVDIRLDSYKPLVLKSAFFVGANNLNKKLNFRTGLGFMSDLKKSGRKSFSDNVGTRYFDGLKDERAFVNFSTSYELNKNTRLNLEFEKSFFGDLNIDYSINANLRYSF
ncbi:autotransporter outer membrane beta-barrel domain-containing protein, partial [Campylobacter jejuni]|uniref:autotransporter outer membrane beta-barrel domain-containing protein n=1 Tax=Campylobacter jejuni TaxID=197 RepID=UPI0006ACAF88